MMSQNNDDYKIIKSARQAAAERMAACLRELGYTAGDPERSKDRRSWQIRCKVKTTQLGVSLFREDYVRVEFWNGNREAMTVYGGIADAVTFIYLRFGVGDLVAATKIPIKQTKAEILAGFGGP